MNKKSWVKEICNNSEELLNIAKQLDSLAWCFNQIGNYDMHQKLSYKSDRILKIVENIKNITSLKVDEDFKQSQQNSSNMLKATLTGIEIRKDEYGKR